MSNLLPTIHDGKTYRNGLVREYLNQVINNGYIVQFKVKPFDEILELGIRDNTLYLMAHTQTKERTTVETILTVKIESTGQLVQRTDNNFRGYIASLQKLIFTIMTEVSCHNDGRFIYN